MKAYGVETQKIVGDNLLSHEFLASIMPFYCCWLPDPEDESKPCKHSVGAGSMLFATQTLKFGHNPEKVWLNQNKLNNINYLSSTYRSVQHENR